MIVPRDAGALAQVLAELADDAVVVDLLLRERRQRGLLPSVARSQPLPLAPFSQLGGSPPSIVGLIGIAGRRSVKAEIFCERRKRS